MNLARLAEILDAYGAEPKRWPLAEREKALALLRDSAEAKALAAAAARLDAALDLAEPVHVSAALMGRILATRETKTRGGLFGPLLRPAFAFALSAFLGIGVGLFVPVFSYGDDADDTAEIAALWLGDNDVFDLTETGNGE